MRAYIKKLQAKDEIVRKQIFFGLMVISMAFVGFIWIYNLTDRFDNKVKEQAREDLKPFKLFANSLSGTYENISASVGNISKGKIIDSINNVSAVDKNEEKKVKEEKQIDLIVVEEVLNEYE
jgi:hypothetical protein